MNQTLGTQLRHLLELLDGAVERSYKDLGLDYKPRFTPIMRALSVREPQSINELVAAAGISQPATTQTVNLMEKKGIIQVTKAEEDGRKKLISLSEQGKQLLIQVKKCWQITALAAEDLECELGGTLSVTLQNAIGALEKKSFDSRIKNASKEFETLNNRD